LCESPLNGFDGNARQDQFDRRAFALDALNLNLSATFVDQLVADGQTSPVPWALEE
jgi:hypothetical protein